MRLGASPPTRGSQIRHRPTARPNSVSIGLRNYIGFIFRNGTAGQGQTSLLDTLAGQSQMVGWKSYRRVRSYRRKPRAFLSASAHSSRFAAFRRSRDGGALPAVADVVARLPVFSANVLRRSAAGWRRRRFARRYTIQTSARATLYQISINKDNNWCACPIAHDIFSLLFH